VHVITDNRQASHRQFSGRRETTLWPARAITADEPVEWLWLSLLILVATVLRALALNQQLWFDEIVTLLDSARLPLARIVTEYGGQNQHMLYSILAHGSIRWLGEQPWTLRLPAVLFGVASIPALYFFGRLVTTDQEALLASALMTANYHHVWFSQNARGYTGMVFWTLLSSIFLIRCAKNDGRRDALLYGVTSALGIYTHLMMACVVAGHVLLYLWLVISRKGPRSRSFFAPAYGFVLCGALSLALYSPVIPGIFAHTFGVARDTVHYEWASPLWALAELVRNLRSSTAGGLLAVAIGGLILLSGLLSYWREDRFVVGLMVLPGLMTAAAVLIASHNFWPRFFFFEIGFAMLLAVRGAMVLGGLASRMLGRSQRFARRADATVVWLMLLASVVPLRAEYLYPKQNYVGALKFLDEHRQPGELILTAGSVMSPFQRYYGRRWPIVLTHAQLETALLADHDTWLVYAMPNSIRSSQPEVWGVIERSFTVVRAFPGTLSGGTIYVCKSKRQ
jgi:uncharacterized membrane protein